MPNKQHQKDHDLLISLNQKVDDFIIEMRASLNEIKDGTVARIESLEKTKADRTDIDAMQKKLDDNIEVRVRSLETDRVTQREHKILIDNVDDLSKGQTKIFAWASAISFFISLLITFVSLMLRK